MKICISFLIGLLIIAAGAAAYGLSQSEPDDLLYAGIIAVVAFVPLVLLIAIRACCATGRILEATAETVSEAARLKANELAASRELTAQKLAIAKENALKLQELHILQAERTGLHTPAAASAGMTSTHTPTAEPSISTSLPTHRLARLIAALATLIVFLATPQMDVFVSLTGVTILRFLFSNGLKDMPGEAWFAILAIAMMFICVFTAYWAKIRIHLTATAITLGLFAALIVMSVAATMSRTPDPDMPELSTAVQAGTGFSWGFYVVVMLVVIQVVMASIAYRKFKSIAADANF